MSNYHKIGNNLINRLCTVPQKRPTKVLRDVLRQNPNFHRICVCCGNTDGVSTNAETKVSTTAKHSTVYDVAQLAKCGRSYIAGQRAGNIALRYGLNLAPAAT